MRRALFLGMAALLAGCAPAALPVEKARAIRTFPHDDRAFTEGLFWLDGHLYESTGEPGRSSIRQVDLATGRVLKRVDIPAPTFGEGIVAWKGRIVSLTWRDGMGWRWRLSDFARLSEWRYPGEGWALTSDGHRLYMSDGTPVIRVLDPDTLAQVGQIAVTADGVAVPMLNELEWVDGEILANIWETDRIARIDPKTGHVVGWIDLSAIHPKLSGHDVDAVANGIAWDAKGRRLFVTGKDWPVLFQIAPPKGR
jgi:glutaminyl-peptide cyclotransferase